MRQARCLPTTAKKIEKTLAAIGHEEYKRRPHRKGPGPMQARCLVPEDFVHKNVETIRSGLASRPYYKYSNPKCTEICRKGKWDSHMLRMTSDLHIPEPAEVVLEHMMNFTLDRESHATGRHFVSHFPSLARSVGDADLEHFGTNMKKIQ